MTLYVLCADECAMNVAQRNIGNEGICGMNVLTCNLTTLSKTNEHSNNLVF
jgi:hypothetical protein